MDNVVYSELPEVLSELPAVELQGFYYPDLRYKNLFRKLKRAETGVLFSNIAQKRAELTLKVVACGGNPLGKMSYPELIASMYDAKSFMDGMQPFDPAWSHFRGVYTDCIRIADAMTSLQAIPFVDHYRKCTFMWSNVRKEVGESSIYIPRHYKQRELGSVIMPTVQIAFTNAYPDDPEKRRGLEIVIQDYVDPEYV